MFSCERLQKVKVGLLQAFTHCSHSHFSFFGSETSLFLFILFTYLSVYVISLFTLIFFHNYFNFLDQSGMLHVPCSLCYASDFIDSERNEYF